MALIRPHVEVLGRRAGDIIPGDLMEQFLRNLYYARRDQCPRWYRYSNADAGKSIRSSVLSPTRDLIIVTIKGIE